MLLMTLALGLDAFIVALVTVHPPSRTATPFVKTKRLWQPWKPISGRTIGPLAPDISAAAKPFLVVRVAVGRHRIEVIKWLADTAIIWITLAVDEK